MGYLYVVLVGDCCLHLTRYSSTASRDLFVHGVFEILSCRFPRRGPHEME